MRMSTHGHAHSRTYVGMVPHVLSRIPTCGAHVQAFLLPPDTCACAAYKDIDGRMTKAGNVNISISINFSSTVVEVLNRYQPNHACIHASGCLWKRNYDETISFRKLENQDLQNDQSDTNEGKCRNQGM